jgi:hypothetical protein
MPWHLQILADLSTLFQPEGTDYAHLITSGTPGFSALRAVGRSKNPRLPVLFGGHNLLPLDEIGLNGQILVRRNTPWEVL